jgi:hypothetical protein
MRGTSLLMKGVARPRIRRGNYVPVYNTQQLDTGSKLGQAKIRRGPRKVSTKESGAPSQRHRAVHRMPHRLARAPRLDTCRFQVEIPARLAIGVVNQHHAIGI